MERTKMRQMSLFGMSQKTIPVTIDPGHSLVRLANVLDWEELVEIAQDRRRKVFKSAAGAKPHLRANVGAVVVRSMKSCDLRSAEDLIRNYLPARYLCALHESDWTPDFRTLCDFEIMLGETGLAAINEIVLQKAREEGFLDVRGLCSDTTAQEAKVPYPNEVGLMNALAKSAAGAFTVVYLEDNFMRDLRKLASFREGTSVAGLIRRAISEFLGKKRSHAGTSFLAKTLSAKPRRSSFGDAMAYQRKLRAEWDR